MNSITIKAETLCKNFSRIEALKDISFSAEGPVILGILGPNGAGKTTLLKILAGFHAASAGNAFVNGFSVYKNYREIKEICGYLPENNPLYGDMTPLEYLEYIADIHFLSGRKKKDAIENVINKCGLETHLNKRIDTLSKGYRQRTGFAAAMVHDPPLLILDEPASGLDPVQIIEFRNLIGELGKQKLLILSTHILHEAETLCSDVIIMNEGCVKVQGSLKKIADSFGVERAKLSLEDVFVKSTERQIEGK